MRARLAAAPGQDAVGVTGESWDGPLRGLLGDTELELTAELGRRHLSVREVLRLKVGDVVALGTGREGPVLVRVEGQPRFLGAPGVTGARHAVQLTARH
jgi:flagellar motor switch protein FliM